ncbi:MAG: trypsin-like peptidase domain-containing protein [Planctomycetota bacterium]
MPEQHRQYAMGYLVRRRPVLVFAALGAIGSCLPISMACGQNGDPDQAVVKMLERVQPAIAVVYAFDEQGRRLGIGSGSVIDPRGYVLTAKHVAGERNIVLLGGRPPLTASVVGRMPEFDVAILRLGHKALQRAGEPMHPRQQQPLDFLSLGVGSEVRMGQTIFNIGSPGGRGIVVSRGMVSAVNFTGVNPLSLALQSSTAFDEMIQFDAASNPGNSGGPLVNRRGQQVGMCVSGIPSEEGIHFAIPMGTVRRCLSEILCNELRYQYVSGIEIDVQSSSVTVQSVVDGSPADDVGLRIGDEIVAVDQRDLRDSIDWTITCAQWRLGQVPELRVQRGDETFTVKLALAPRKRERAVELDDASPGLLCYAEDYDPANPSPLANWQRPDVEPTTMTKVGPIPVGQSEDDHYRVSIEGFLRIEKAGRHRLALESDDGSKLFIHDHLVIDNDGNHAEILRSGWVDLEAGLHPIRIQFYEDQGSQVLEFRMALGDDELTPVDPKNLFHDDRLVDAEAAN